METQEAGFGGKKSEFHPGLNPERKTAGQYLVTLPDGSTLRADSLQGTIEALEDYRRNQGN